MEADAPIGWAAAEFRRISLLFDRPADARQALEYTPLLNFAVFADHFALCLVSISSHVTACRKGVRPSG
jgi:hypothetical protein